MSRASSTLFGGGFRAAAIIACGILANGFARVHCTQGGRDELAASPARAAASVPRAAAGAWRRRPCISDAVLPAVPIRRQVLSFPYRVRYLLADDAKLFSSVRRIAALWQCAQPELARPCAGARRGLREREPARAARLPACRAAHRPGRRRAHHSPAPSPPAPPHLLRPPSAGRTRRKRGPARRAVAR